MQIVRGSLSRSVLPARDYSSGTVQVYLLAAIMQTLMHTSTPIHLTPLTQINALPANECISNSATRVLQVSAGA